MNSLLNFQAPSLTSSFFRNLSKRSSFYSSKSQLEHQNSFKVFSTKTTHAKTKQVILYGDFSYWANGLAYGFWIFFTAFILVALSYLCMVVCISEINSCIPFSGGCYGFVRIAISSMMGYLVACSDRLHAGLLFGRSMLMIGKVITTASDAADTGYLPLYWLGISGCGVLLFLFLWEIEKFWRVMTVQGVLTIVLLGWFCVAVALQEGFAHSVYGGAAWMIPALAAGDDAAIGEDCTGIKAILRCLPMIMLCFSGLEVLPCVAGTVSDPRLTIPRAGLMAYSITAIIGLVLLVFVACSASFPLSLITSSPDLALNAIWAQAMGWSTAVTSWCSLSPFLAGLLGSIFAFDAFSSAMTQSNFTFLTCTTCFSSSSTGTASFSWDMAQRVAPLLWGIGEVLILIVVLHYATRTSDKIDLVWVVAEVGLLSSLVVHAGLYCSYLQLHCHYSSLKRKYSFPALGQYVAYLGLGLDGLLCVAIVGFSSCRLIVGSVFGCYLIYCMGCYLLYIQKVQRYSEEEETILFVVHVVKANMDRLKRVHHHQYHRQSSAKSLHASLQQQKQQRSISDIFNSSSTLGKANVKKVNVMQRKMSNKLLDIPSSDKVSSSITAITESQDTSTTMRPSVVIHPVVSVHQQPQLKHQQKQQSIRYHPSVMEEIITTTDENRMTIAAIGNQNAGRDDDEYGVTALPTTDALFRHTAAADDSKSSHRHHPHQKPQQRIAATAHNLLRRSLNNSFLSRASGKKKQQQVHPTTGNEEEVAALDENAATIPALNDRNDNSLFERQADDYANDDDYYADNHNHQSEKLLEHLIGKLSAKHPVLLQQMQTNNNCHENEESLQDEGEAGPPLIGEDYMNAFLDAVYQQREGKKEITPLLPNQEADVESRGGEGVVSSFQLHRQVVVASRQRRRSSVSGGLLRQSFLTYNNNNNINSSSSSSKKISSFTPLRSSLRSSLSSILQHITTATTSFDPLNLPNSDDDNNLNNNTNNNNYNNNDNEHHEHEMP